MKITILGLPQVGKTTIFNAVTKGDIKVTGYSDKVNIGVAKVPDYRLDNLTDLYNPKRTVQAEITYSDLPFLSDGLGKSEKIEGEHLNLLQQSDVLILVARAFSDLSIPHFGDQVDPFNEINTLLYELIFADLEILERRIDKLNSENKSVKKNERDQLNYELEVLSTFKNLLEDGIPGRDHNFSDKEMKLLSRFQFVSFKPLIIVVNIDEDQLHNISDWENKLTQLFSSDYIRSTVLCGKLEMELAQMPNDEQTLFRDSLEIQHESGLDQMVRLSYDALNLISFITVGKDEVRALTIPKGYVAIKAAGKIHSDLERGFIRAEVVTYKDLISTGSLTESRKKGLLRQEGKDYLVNDGDIMHVLFNV